MISQHEIAKKDNVPLLRKTEIYGPNSEMTRRLEILDSELRTTVITIIVKRCSGKDGKHGKSGRYFQ